MFTLEKVSQTVLMSSQDPEKLSLTIKGLLVQLVPVIILVLQAFGIASVEADIVAIIESVAVMVAIVFSFIGLLMSTWGMVRKMFNPEDFRELTK